MGPQAGLKVELLGNDTRPLPGYSGVDAALVRQSGFQSPITFSGKSEVRDLPERIRLRVTFEGERKKDIRFSAIYLRTDP